MSKLPVICAKQLWFEIQLQKGSHKFYKHPDGRYTTIPHHPGEDLSRPLIRAIIRQIDLDTNEFIRLLNS
jgi:predicted RNA binding protein YcfA (HicA-like mRNA interferase family)